MAETLVERRGEKTRDAARSREAILEAAEGLFAERGFEAASLNEIGAAAGLSRGTPSYFFGSKDQLYRAVLERVFDERERATREAFAPLDEWSVARGTASLEEALTKAVSGYMEFLLRRPSFLKLLQREELRGGRHLRATRRESKAMKEAFDAVRSAGSGRGVRAFNVDDAVLLFVSLTFSPLTQRSTFMTSLGRRLEEPMARRHHIRLAVDQLLHLVGSG
jgi:TetR/AcrR family transcriptional regulator